MDGGVRAWSMGGLMSPVVGGEGRTAKVSAAVTVAWNVAQAVASLVVLFLERGKHCDQRLALWLLVATGRIILRLGLCGVAYKYFLLDSEDIRRQQERAALDTPPQLQSPMETPPPPRRSERASLIDKLKEVLDVFHLVWFTLGNAWTFGARTCRLTAPLTFYTSLTIIVVTCTTHTPHAS